MVLRKYLPVCHWLQTIPFYTFSQFVFSSANQKNGIRLICSQVKNKQEPNKPSRRKKNMLNGKIPSDADINSAEIYLARPYVNIWLPSKIDEAHWLTQEVEDYSTTLFHEKIIANPTISARTIFNLPNPKCPQIAVIGRSNVGKSTLINALMYGKAVAHISSNNVNPNKMLTNPTSTPVSSSPGHTRYIFTFNLGSCLSLADLPGYGFALVSKRTKHEWSELVENYLKLSTSLSRVLCLIDPMKGLTKADQNLFALLQEAEREFMIVFTKIDRLQPKELHSCISSLLPHLRQLPREYLWPYIHAVSGKYANGLNDLRNSLAAIALTHKYNPSNSFHSAKLNNDGDLSK